MKIICLGSIVPSTFLSIQLVRAIRREMSPKILKWTRVLAPLFTYLVLSFQPAHADLCELAYKNIVIVVDSYSSGQHLAPEFSALGYELIHVATNPDPEPYFKNTFRPENFVERLTLTTEDELRTFIDGLKNAGVNPAAVIAGAEPGVPVADWLAGKLNLVTANPLRYSNARFNKSDLYQRLLDAGVPVAHFKMASEVEPLIQFASEKNLKKVMLKPVEGSGSTATYICTSESEIRSAFKKIQNARKGRASVHDNVVIQEYLEGTEYAVNFVSSNGRHILTDIWKYVRDEIPGAGTAYGADILLPATGPIQSALLEYAKKVLDAVELQYGASHLEIKMTSRGPLILDLGARLCGADLPRMAGEATRRNIPALVAKAYVDPASFMSERSGYTLAEQKIVVFLRSAFEGKGRLRDNVEATLRRLPWVKAVRLNYKPGDLLKRTVDSDTIVGTVELAGPDLGSLQDIMKAIRVLEKQGEFEKE